MAFSSLFLAAQGGLQGLSSTISDLSQTIGVDLFEEDIDNVVFQTNEFLCNPDFIGTQGPFWWILQMSMALGALFSIIVGASMAYKMMVKGEPVDVFKILKVMGIALIMIFWYPPSMTGMGSGNGSILDALAYIPNCIGSYTHDLYEAEAVQVSEKYNELMPLLQKRDTMYQKAAAVEAASEGLQNDASIDALTRYTSGSDAVEGIKAAARAKKSSVFAGLIIGFDKIVMFLALVLYRVGWWATIFCQQILLGMLTIFGPIQWAFSVLPKWEGAWAKWLIRYLTVHFYGAMLYFVGFYVLLLFDIVISVQVENLTAITSSTGTINGYIQNAFLTCGYLLAASVVALRCLNLVPDLAAWMIPEGDTAFSTRNFGEGVASSVKSSAMSVMPRIH
ncbi:hypothetical protein SAMN02745202_01270 [Segatella oulorum]|jgi:hypothetical protein|uniref:TrbL/VirB6 plasmid conjugal transfer protein n=1 Tax=Segatella oulorum TaxID=28136 RepID=A0A1T4P1E3_9BACT|nr:hypothetical protein [Segatella oulorum]SJZ85430.1 hypothetical protein SAMN02745202_01270 [Segatella oulorum]